MNTNDYPFIPCPISYDEAIEVPHPSLTRSKPLDFDIETLGVSQGYGNCLQASVAMATIYWEKKLGFKPTSQTIDMWNELADKIERGRGPNIQIIYGLLRKGSTSHQKKYKKSRPIGISSQSGEIPFEHDEIEDDVIIVGEDGASDLDTEKEISNEEISFYRINRIRTNTFAELVPPYNNNPQIPQIMIFDNNPIRNLPSKTNIHAALLSKIDIIDRHIELIDPAVVESAHKRLTPQGHHLSDFFRGWQSTGMFCLQIYPKLMESNIERLRLTEYKHKLRQVPLEKFLFKPRS